jgi:hypothetical protein
MYDRGWSRRDVLKALGIAGTSFELGNLLGCATAQVSTTDIAASLAAIKAEPVVFPKLRENKVQPPERGCLVGFYTTYWREQDMGLMRLRPDLAYRGNSIEGLAATVKSQAFQDFWNSFDFPGRVGNNIEDRKAHLGRKPAVMAFMGPHAWYTNFPTGEATRLAQQGIIPYVYMGSFSQPKPSLRMELADIIKGRYDNLIGDVARQAKEFGDTFGGFFVTTLHEMNGSWFYWGQSSRYVDTWRRMVDVFEKSGANQYATWVWYFACPEANQQTDHPDRYYPGDDYVDWIGFSAYNRDMLPNTHKPFEALIGQSYTDMSERHFTKPMMMSESGKTTGSDQAKFIAGAYLSLKRMPRMKAAILWDHVSFGPLSPGIEGDDKTLTEQSWAVLREIVKDPHFITAGQ